MQGVDMGNCFVGAWDIANDASDVRQLIEKWPSWRLFITSEGAACAARLLWLRCLLPR